MTVRFDLPTAARVDLRVFNILGQEVATLAGEVKEAGSHRVYFNGAGLPSGVYFHRLESTPVSGDGYRQVGRGKALLLKEV